MLSLKSLFYAGGFDTLLQTRVKDEVLATIVFVGAFIVPQISNYSLFLMRSIKPCFPGDRPLVSDPGFNVFLNCFKCVSLIKELLSVYPRGALLHF